MTGALIMMIGIQGSGKSTLAAQWFNPTQITNLDRLRGLLTDDESDQTATADAVRLQTILVHGRCERGLVTCVDNTNLMPDHRAALLGFAEHYGLPTYAVVFDIEPETAVERNRRRARAGLRDVPEDVIRDFHQRKAQYVPADGPVDGFTVTTRIDAAGGRRRFGEVPAEHRYRPWGV